MLIEMLEDASKLFIPFLPRHSTHPLLRGQR